MICRPTHSLHPNLECEEPSLSGEGSCFDWVVPAGIMGESEDAPGCTATLEVREKAEEPSPTEVKL